MDAKFITNFDNRSRFYVEWSVMNHETGAHHNGTQGPMICRSFLRREQILWPLQSLGPWLSSFGALNTWNERNKRLTVLLGAPSKGSWRSRTSTNSLSWKRWWRRRCACTLRQGSSSPMNLASHATWPATIYPPTRVCTSTSWPSGETKTCGSSRTSFKPERFLRSNQLHDPEGATQVL